MFVQRQVVSQKIAFRGKNGEDMGTQEVPVLSAWETIEVKLVPVNGTTPQVADLQNTEVAAVLPVKPPRYQKKGGKRCLAPVRAKIQACIASKKFTPQQIADAFGLDKQTIYSEAYMMGKKPKLKKFYTLPETQKVDGGVVTV
jgi:hypothetical protein